MLTTTALTGTGFAGCAIAGAETTAGEALATNEGRPAPDKAKGRAAVKKMLMVPNLGGGTGENKTPGRFFRRVFLNIGSVLR